jgi:hypothetical protein
MIKGIGYNVYRSTKSFVECTGISKVFQNQLLVIDQRVVSIMPGVFLDPLVSHLRVYDA